MKKYSTLLIIIFCFSFASCKQKSSQDTQITEGENYAKEQLKNYPKAEEGYLRHVIFLPVLDKQTEQKQKIEIFAGKTMLLDCNQHSLEGLLKTEYVKGFGYPFYALETDGHIQSTLMLCPDNEKNEVFVHAPSVTRYYDSKLPIVIYTPKGYEVRYKIWTAGKLQKVEK